MDEALGKAKDFILNERADSTTNKEQEITDSLLDAIDTSENQLEDLKAWTVGGKAVIQPIVNLMYDDLIADTSNTNRTEDLMQLLVFDFLLNQDDWAPELTLTVYEEKYLGDITENFGSDLHAVYLDYNNHSPTKIVNWFLDQFIDKIQKNGNIPSDSVKFKIIQFFDDSKNKDNLRGLAQKYTESLSGINISNGNFNLENSLTKNEGNTHLSPTLKFFLLAQGAKEGLLSANDWVNFINADIE
ncbi:hypothetical protein [Vibrio parahaemolyticus]|uniref:hypothetical protein n=1 Tax=Vibrio parahaemolyticus TaxID=670 RepID=UPI0004084DD8|nr:hypothetical protein [Vibrio parahaemolyticus]